MQSKNYRRDDYISSFRSSGSTPGLGPTLQRPRDVGPLDIPVQSPPETAPQPDTPSSELTNPSPQPPQGEQRKVVMRQIYPALLMLIFMFGVLAWVCLHPSPDEALVNAARDGNLAQARIALAKGANVDAECGCQRTALSWAATNGHIDVASLLISQGADVNLTDKHGDSALTMDAANQNADIVALLVAHRAYVNQMNDQGGTALWSAVKNDQIGVARTLLVHKANLDVPDERGRTMLMEAVDGGSLPMVKLLLANGARVNGRSADGQSAYGEAILGHREDIASVLSASISPEETGA